MCLEILRNKAWLAIFISAFTTGFGLEKENSFELLNETLIFMEFDEVVVGNKETGHTLQKECGGE